MIRINGQAQTPPRSRRIAAVLFLAAGVASGCSKSTPQSIGPVDAAADVSFVDLARGGSDAAGSDALIGSRPDIPLDSQPIPPANVLFPEPPQVTCTAVIDCEFPPSVCANPSCDGGICPGYSWVVYYDNPQCTAGQCVFEQRYFQCSGALVCSLGGCRFNGTAVAAP